MDRKREGKSVILDCASTDFPWIVLFLPLSFCSIYKTERFNVSEDRE